MCQFSCTLHQYEALVQVTYTVWLQVSDEDDAAVAVALADKLEAAVSSQLVLPEKHGLTPSPNTLLNAEVE